MNARSRRISAVAALAAASALIPLTSTAEAPAPAPTPYFCVGLDDACAEGLAYWPAQTAFPLITVRLDPTLPESYSGSALGDITTGMCHVSIAPEYASRWEVYAHEFGHCAGLHHAEDGTVSRPAYTGIMSYTYMWEPTPDSHSDDARWAKEAIRNAD